MIATLVVSGCELSDPCDPDQYVEHGICYARAVDAADIDADDNDAGDQPDAHADPFMGFGTACTLQTECATFELVCGESFLPYCTRTNCLGAANSCPPDWTCLDTGGLGPDPNVTSVCLKP